MTSSALDNRISRVRIVTRPSNPVGARAADWPPGAFAAAPLGLPAAAAGSGYDGDNVIPDWASAVQRDADDAAEIILLGAFLWIPGDIHLALRHAVATQARGGVIFRHHHPVGWPALGIGHLRIGLAARPGGFEELGLDDLLLEAVGARLAVAHQLRRRSHLQLRIAIGQPGERLGDHPPEHRWNESLEPDSLGIDRRLVGIHNLGNRRHHRAQQPAVARGGIDRHRIDTGVLLVGFDRLVEHHLGGQPLVADFRIVDPALVVGDDRARVAQHLGQALRDLGILFRRRLLAKRSRHDRGDQKQGEPNPDQPARPRRTCAAHSEQSPSAKCVAARYSASFTYSKLPGWPSMPACGGAIHDAKLPGSVTGRIRLSMNRLSAVVGKYWSRRRCHSSWLSKLPSGSAWIVANS